VTFIGPEIPDAFTRGRSQLLGNSDPSCGSMMHGPFEVDDRIGREVGAQAVGASAALDDVATGAGVRTTAPVAAATAGVAAGLDSGATVRGRN
jgi:hypothetical protein